MCLIRGDKKSSNIAVAERTSRNSEENAYHGCMIYAWITGLSRINDGKKFILPSLRRRIPVAEVADCARELHVVFAASSKMYKPHQQTR